MTERKRTEKLNEETKEETTQLSELELAKALFAEQIKLLQDEIKGLKEIKTDDVKSSTVTSNPANDYLNENVPFYAFQDDDKYKDDIVVGINGKNWVIKRGCHVMVPRFFYNAIIDADRQRGEAANTSRKYADQFAAETRARNIE